MGRHRQKANPPAGEGHLGGGLQEAGVCPGLGPSKLANEGERLVAPSPTHLDAKNHKPAAAAAEELSVLLLFAPTSLLQLGAVNLGSTGLGVPLRRTGETMVVSMAN